MKISLTVDTACRSHFVKEDGSAFVFPGQDLVVYGGPTEEEKCNAIYVGPEVIDKLDCEPTPDTPGEPDYIPVDEGGADVIPEPPPIIIIPPICDCNVSLEAPPPTGSVAYVNVKNYGDCDLTFNAYVFNQKTEIRPNENIPIAPGETVVLTVYRNFISTDPSPPVITTKVQIITDKCGSYETTAIVIPHRKTWMPPP